MCALYFRYIICMAWLGYKSPANLFISSFSLAYAQQKLMAFKRVFCLSKLFLPPGVMSCHSGTRRRWYKATTAPRSFTWLHYGLKTLIRRQDGPTCVPIAVCGALEMAYLIHRRQKILLFEHELIKYSVVGSSSLTLAWVSKYGVSLRDDYLQGKQEFYKIEGKVVNALHTMVIVGWALDDKNEV